MDINTAYENGRRSVIEDVRKYLLDCIEEWNNLGDRKYELANIQVYNHIRKCLDDLEEYEDTAPILKAKIAEWLSVDMVKSFGTIHGFRCSSCEKETVRDYPYCPHCGAKMTIKDADSDG